MTGKPFREKDGQVVWLLPQTERHIQDKHGLIEAEAFIADTLSNPIAILRSKWEPDTRIYFKASGHLYQAVIVSWLQRRIKTAHLMRRIEGGDMLWHASPRSA